MIDETGNKYGKLLVIGQERRNERAKFWKCLCDCGKEKTIRGDRLRNEGINHCGCDRRKCENRKPRPKIYFLDENFFSKNTLKANYWAGFIAADGCIKKDNKQLVITLSIKDREHLAKLVQDLKTSHFLKEAEYGGKKRISLWISSSIVVKTLLDSFKITQAKSLTLEYPKFKDKTKEDAFLVGYIDGDGYIQQKRCARIDVLGTFTFLKGVKSRFEEILGKTDTVKIKAKPNTKVYCIEIYGERARKLFLHFSKIKVRKLERKWKDQNNIYKQVKLK